MDLALKVVGERGVVMLEALITIIILAFGILGLAPLMAAMQTAEVESCARSQALVLLDDMAERLSAHRGVAATCNYDPWDRAHATDRLFRHRAWR
jgi:Tfp pilus assembly protein PilV